MSRWGERYFSMRDPDGYQAKLFEDVSRVLCPLRSDISH